MVTPGINVSAVSMATVEEASSVQGDCDSNEDVSLPPSNYEAFNLAGFDIDWCKYSVSTSIIHTYMYVHYLLMNS